jgi:hypothetical protein
MKFEDLEIGQTFSFLFDVFADQAGWKYKKTKHNEITCVSAPRTEGPEKTIGRVWDMNPSLMTWDEEIILLEE